MKKEIFEKIIQNKTDFKKDEIEYLQTYVKLNILKQNNNKFEISKKYKIGILQILNDGAKLLPLNKSEKTINIDDTKSCNNGDLVIIQVIFNPRGKLKGKIIELIQSNQTSSLCYIKESKLYDIKTLTLVNYKINIKSYKDGDVLLIQDSNVKEIYGNINDNSIDEKISLYLYNQEYRIKEKYTCNINSIKEDESRIDLTNLEFATIDPISAKDHDDAIYYDSDTSELYVAIADVSAFIKEGSNLDKQAYKRAFSIYLPNKVLPMIPHELSDDLCSLKPNVNRLAFVCKMKIDIKTASVKSSEIFEATICSKHKYSYEDIDQKIQNNTMPKDLDALYTLTKKLKKNRLKKGYDFRTSEYRLVLDEQLNLIKVNEEQGSPSHSLVEECMLLANIQAASKLNEIGIFRVHEEPNRKKIEDLVKSLALLGIDVKLKEDIHSTIISIQQKALNTGLENEVDKLIIQSQQQASYQTKQLGHFGLGFSSYSHFTSPIRRYSDLVLHRIIKTKRIPKDIDDVCEYISTKEREIAKCVWDLEDRIYARYASKHIGQDFQAIISDVDEHPCVEFISNIAGLKADVINYESQSLFSKVDVRIEQSDVVTKVIKVKII